MPHLHLVGGLAKPLAQGRLTPLERGPRWQYVLVGADTAPTGDKLGARETTFNILSLRYFLMEDFLRRKTKTSFLFLIC